MKQRHGSLQPVEVNHQMRIGFLISSARVIRSTWTTTHLAQAALDAGHTVRFLEATDLEVTAQGRPVARAAVLDSPCLSVDALAHQLSSQQLVRRYIEIESLDILLLRANPLTSTVMSCALMAQERGVEVYNDPMGLARTRSKSWLATLQDVPRPATLVTTLASSARLFAENQEHGVVLKPAVGCGGRGVRWVPKPVGRKVISTFEDIQRIHPGPIVVQAYLPEAADGEKRLFWVDGQIVGAYLRTRSPGSFHHNLQRGGQPIACSINDGDRLIAEAIGPHLRRNGIRIAGLDIIGSALIECNTLNPGGIHYAESFREAGGLSLAGQTIQHLVSSSPLNRIEVRHA